MKNKMQKIIESNFLFITIFTLLHMEYDFRKKHFLFLILKMRDYFL